MRNCANCNLEISGWVRPWHKCQACGKEFCGVCGDKLIDSSMRCKECRNEKNLNVRRLI
jgi:CO dehydrogenase/acetyl-CoA synthase gamma subunit (corrinoid Fe-S protein)